MSSVSSDLRRQALLRSASVLAWTGARKAWTQSAFEDEDTQGFFLNEEQSPDLEGVLDLQWNTIKEFDMISPMTAHQAWAGKVDQGYRLTLQSSLDGKTVRSQAIYRPPDAKPTLSVTWKGQRDPTILLADSLHFEDDTENFIDRHREAWTAIASYMVDTIHCQGYMDSKDGLVEPLTGTPLTGSVGWVDDDIFVEVNAMRKGSEIPRWVFDKDLGLVSRSVWG